MTPDFDKLKAIHVATGGKITKCSPGIPPGYKYHKGTSTRSKKNLTYDTTSAPALRSFNYNSVCNAPAPYNGQKIPISHY